MGNECGMALLQGPGTAVFIYTYRDAVYESFGPFDIGPCLEVVIGLIVNFGIGFPN